MKVVFIEHRRAPETGEVLRYLLRQWERGELRGLALCAKSTRNAEDVSFTGCYAEDPAVALLAALRMSMLLNRMDLH